MVIRLRKPTDKTKWHRWFALLPVRMAEELRWLETVERRGTMIIEANTDGMPVEVWAFEYRPAGSE